MLTSHPLLPLPTLSIRLHRFSMRFTPWSIARRSVDFQFACHTQKWKTHHYRCLGYRASMVGRSISGLYHVLSFHTERRRGMAGSNSSIPQRLWNVGKKSSHAVSAGSLQCHGCWIFSGVGSKARQPRRYRTRATGAGENGALLLKLLNYAKGNMGVLAGESIQISCPGSAIAIAPRRAVSYPKRLNST